MSDDQVTQFLCDLLARGTQFLSSGGVADLSFYGGPEHGFYVLVPSVPTKYRGAAVMRDGEEVLLVGSAISALAVEPESEELVRSNSDLGYVTTVSSDELLKLCYNHSPQSNGYE